NSSLESMADLPDGTVQIDLLSGSCTHTTAGDLQLPMVEDFRSWLSQQIEQSKIEFNVFHRAIVSLRYKTDRVRTDRSRILLFDLECESQFALADQVIEGRAVNALWYQRQAG